MDSPNLAEKRRRIMYAHLDHIVTAWVQRPSKIQDPVVVVADSADLLGRSFVQSDVLGVAVQVVSAKQLAAMTGKIAPAISAKLDTVDTRSLYAVCLTYNGHASAYINAAPRGGYVPESKPGRAPSYMQEMN